MADKDVRGVVNRVVMPGDFMGNVADLEASLEGKVKIRLGPGLREENGAILAHKAGVLRHRKPATYLIDCNQRRVSSLCNTDFVPSTRMKKSQTAYKSFHP